MEEMSDIKEENDEEKSDFKMIDSYSMNHMTSSSTDAHVSGDCHSETQDDTGQLIDLLLHDFKEEPLSEKTCAVDDENCYEGLASEGLYNEN